MTPTRVTVNDVTSRVIVICVIMTSAELMSPAYAINWLALSTSQRAWNRTRDCRIRDSYRLGSVQRGLCSENLDLMPSVTRAARSATEVCQRLFAEQRWNCSSVLLAPKFTPDLTGGSREQAFVYALSSAAVLQTVSKTCSSGVASKCGCGRTPPVQAGVSGGAAQGFKWGGCADNVEFGAEFSRVFCDARWLGDRQRRRRRSKRAAMNLHNNNAGRMLVLRSMTTKCKCHGVSGSCSVKTCWRSLADLQTVGQQIYQNYVVAVEVRSRRLPGSKQRRLLPAAHTGRTEFSDDDLLFYTQSPDYCHAEPLLGSSGTTNRICRKNDPGSGGCRSMCCGRDYWTTLVDVQYRCDCKYYWCCYVRCKTCTRKVEVNRCR